MSEIKSIWDGWEKQCFFRGTDSGAACAAIYPGYREEAYSTFERVAKHIRTRFHLPEVHIHEVSKSPMHPRTHALDTIVYANNVLKLTPEQFREIDRASQIAEGMAAVETLVNTVEAPCLQTR